MRSDIHSDQHLHSLLSLILPSDHINYGDLLPYHSIKTDFQTAILKLDIPKFLYLPKNIQF